MNCWVAFAAPDGAKLLARHYVEKEGWIVSRRAAVFAVDEARCKKDRKEKQYFAEAESYGYCLVFHCYPLEETKRD